MLLIGSAHVINYVSLYSMFVQFQQIVESKTLSVTFNTKFTVAKFAYQTCSLVLLWISYVRWHLLRMSS